MKKSLKRLSAILAVVMLASLLGACGNKSGQTSGSGEKIKLTMVESLTNPERTKVLRALADDYQSKNSNVTIEIISPPLDGADQKIQQMFQNKNDMDVLEVRDVTVTQFVNNNWLYPLDDSLKKWNEMKTLTEVTKINATEVNGKYNFIPYGQYMKCLYYRKDWLQEAGINVPKTWDELYEAAKKLTDPGKGRYGWTLRGVSGGYDMVALLTRAAIGKDRVSLTEALYDKNGKSMYSQPEAVDSLNYMKKLYTDCSPSDSVAWAFPDQVQAFTSGTTAFLLQDPEVVAICQENMKEGTWATAPLPLDAKSKQFPISAGYAGWGVAAHSKHPEQAADFVKFLSNVDNNNKFCKAYSVIPIHTNAAAKEPFFKSGPFAAYVTMMADPKHYFVTSFKHYEKETENFKIVETDYANVLTGKMDVNDAIAKWGPMIDDQRK